MKNSIVCLVQFVVVEAAQNAVLQGIELLPIAERKLLIVTPVSSGFKHTLQIVWLSGGRGLGLVERCTKCCRDHHFRGQGLGLNSNSGWIYCK